MGVAFLYSDSCVVRRWFEDGGGHVLQLAMRRNTPASGAFQRNGRLGLVSISSWSIESDFQHQTL